MTVSRPCQIPGCPRPWRKRQWCQTHYEQWRRTGHPIALRPSLEERFWSKVDKNGPGGCWLWNAQRTPHGYGRFQIDRRTQPAHRVAYELAVGPIPVGLHLDHLCRNTSCVNPEHLEPVTPAENQRRAAAAKTHCVHGHLYDEANTYRDRRGHRFCRACHRESERRWTERVAA